jgi:hypothetical protein
MQTHYDRAHTHIVKSRIHLREEERLVDRFVESHGDVTTSRHEADVGVFVVFGLENARIDVDLRATEPLVQISHVPDGAFALRSSVEASTVRTVGDNTSRMRVRENTVMSALPDSAESLGTSVRDAALASHGARTRIDQTHVPVFAS